MTSELYSPAFFKPPPPLPAAPVPRVPKGPSKGPSVSPTGGGAGDQRTKVSYVFSDDITLAVNVALAAARPLLVRGPSGTGKSSLARAVRDVLDARFYEKVVDSRTQAKDLLYEVDLLRRLHDAQAKTAAFSDDFTPYIVPGVLWWAFAESSARDQLARLPNTKRKEPHDAATSKSKPKSSRAVVLIDEIDKADPDTPNNLLVPLGSFYFRVDETGEEVSLPEDQRQSLAPLIIITTNDERDLPPAFLRRCVELRLDYPNRERMVEIARAQVPDAKEQVIKRLAEEAYGTETTTKVSPAEFVDALRACASLNIDVRHENFPSLLRSNLWTRVAKDANA